MREEVLRLSMVTCRDRGAVALDHFCLSLFAGEIMGLLPLNDTGLSALLRLLKQNTPIHYGYIHYRERLVNDWQGGAGGYNRVGVIGEQSGLADDLTVADNVFVLRQGFRKGIIRRGVLRAQLEPMLRDLGVQIFADTVAGDLSAFERVVVELVKAVVAGNRLIVLSDVGTVVSDAQLHTLHSLIKHYAGTGVAFLYVSQHYEEIRQVCDTAALMMNGRILSVRATEALKPEALNGIVVRTYERMVRTQKKRASLCAEATPALDIRGLRYGAITGLSLSVSAGECVVVQDLNNQIFEDFLKVMTGRARGARGGVRVGGEPLTRKNARDIAILQKKAADTMLFPDLSYLDNLCFALDHRFPGVWAHARQKEGIRRECAAWLGEAVFDKPVEELTQAQRDDLIYARVLLQRPRVAVCVQPFMQADMERRMHIWRLLEKLLDQRIAVVILAVNLADTLSLADRLIRVRDGAVTAVYARSEFGALPSASPWRYLWDV